jgi:hypothetical protein
MIMCGACQKWIDGTKYSETPKLCYECGAELPDSIKETLNMERKAAMVHVEQSITGVDGSTILPILFMCVAVALIAIGFYQIFGKIGYSDKIVEGDAFNYMIYAERGLAWIGAGLVCAVLACGCALVALLNKQASIR